MKSRWLVNIFLLFLVIILGVMVYTSHDGNNKLSTLTTLDGKSISKIEIRHKGRDEVLMKTGEHWRLTKPV